MFFPNWAAPVPQFGFKTKLLAHSGIGVRSRKSSLSPSIAGDFL
jgi:hypothetical protein